MKLWKLNTQILISSINFAIKFMNSLFLLKFEFMCLYLLLVFATSVIIEQETGENLSLIVSHLFYEFWRFNLILLIKFNGIARSQTWISFLSKIISDTVGTLIDGPLLIFINFSSKLFCLFWHLCVPILELKEAVC